MQTSDRPWNWTSKGGHVTVCSHRRCLRLSGIEMDTHRFLLCRPGGGLNDVLCQIEKCWLYSIRFNRHLLIDTSSTGILDDFSKYFAVEGPSRSAVSTRLYPEAFEALNNLSIRPTSLAGRVSDYRHVYDQNTYQYIEDKDGDPLTFDFEIDWPEKLLVHSQCGGGDFGIDCLRRLRLEPLFRVLVSKRLATLPKNYEAIHVRNTDMKTDYFAFFENLKRELTARNLLICSDDRACIEHAKVFFRSCNIFSASEIPNLPSGGRLHENSALNRFKANTDAIVDLFALSGASRIHYTRPSSNNAHKFSGFSRLAVMLHADPQLRSCLLNS